jgi:hypothetical protein
MPFLSYGFCLPAHRRKAVNVPNFRAAVLQASGEGDMDANSDSLRVDVLAFLRATAPDTDAHATTAGHKRPRPLDHDEALLRPAEPEPQDEEALAHLLVGLEASAAFEAASTSVALHTLLERVRSMHERCELHAGKLVSACEVEATRRGLDAPLLVAWSLHESGLVPIRTWLERSRTSWTGSLRKLHERAEALPPGHNSLDMAILDAVCLQLVAGTVEEAATSQTRQRCEDALHAFCARGDGQTAPSVARLAQLLHTASRLATMGGAASGGAASGGAASGGAVRVASALLRSRLRGAAPMRTRGGGADAGAGAGGAGGARVQVGGVLMEALAAAREWLGSAAAADCAAAFSRCAAALRTVLGARELGELLMNALEERGDNAPLDAPCWLGLMRALAAADAPLACELASQQQRALEAALAEAAQGQGQAAAAAPVAVLLFVGSTIDLSRATHDAVAAAAEEGGGDVDEDRPLAAARKAELREPAAAATPAAPPRHEEWLRRQLESSAGAAAAAAADAGGGGKGGGGKGGDAARRGGVARLLRALTELAPVHLADELKLHARLAKQVNPLALSPEP